MKLRLHVFASPSRPPTAEGDKLEESVSYRRLIFCVRSCLVFAWRWNDPGFPWRDANGTMRNNATQCANEGTAAAGRAAGSCILAKEKGPHTWKVVLTLWQFEGSPVGLRSLLIKNKIYFTAIRVPLTHFKLSDFHSKWRQSVQSLLIA